MYVNIEFATFQGFIEDGYTALPVERVFTHPFRVEQDVQNAFEDMCERMMKVNPDVEVGIVTYTIEATHEELMKMARKTVSNGLWNYGVPGRQKLVEV